VYSMFAIALVVSFVCSSCESAEMQKHRKNSVESDFLIRKVVDSIYKDTKKYRQGFFTF